MFKLSELFGNRIVIARLDKPESGGHLPTALFDPSQSPGGTRQVLFADDFNAGYYGKGRVELIGRPVPWSPVAVADTEWPGSIGGGEGEGPEGEERGPGGPSAMMRDYVREFMALFTASQRGESTAPIPPIKVGDVVVYVVSTSRPLPESPGFYIVESNGIVGVVSPHDFDPLEGLDHG